MSRQNHQRGSRRDPGGSAPRASRALDRDPQRLAAEPFDVAIVGAGIHGAWTALDAARRGLSVCLVDQGDFGEATSANSQRIVHGGLRYLQHGDLRRMRQSIHERSTLIRVAPHLVSPLPYLVPTQGLGLRSRAVMAVALRLNDLVSWDRNRGIPASRAIPRGMLVSRRRCLELCPGLDAATLSGGALFHDAQVHDSERLCLSLLRSARQAGAEIANYVRVTGFLRDGGAITGFEATDRLTDRTLAVRARLVIGCAGPWTARTAGWARNAGGSGDRDREFPTFKATVLVTRPIVRGIGLALAGRVAYRDRSELIRKGFRYYFVAPWRGRSLVGTFYEEHRGDPDRLTVTPEEIGRYLSSFNEIFPSAALEARDVTHAFVGLLPRETGRREDRELIYAKEYRLVDHETEDGTAGLLSAVGVKWTTARGVACRTVDLALRKLGLSPVDCATADEPIHGGDVGDPEEFLERCAGDRPPELSPESFSHLLQLHGSAYGEVLESGRGSPSPWTTLAPDVPQVRAQVVHAVRAEMACTLEDVVLRRTGLGTVGWPGRACVEACAEVMGGELGWDSAERERQIGQLQATYERVGVFRGRD